MPLQINTSKWSPSDVLRQRIMAAMEREAQYRTTLTKQSEQARKEVITTEAMRDYQNVAGQPNASRESVYSATQQAFGRILGVDTEAAKSFAAESGIYPKFYPTDTNTSELEAYLRANQGKDQAETMKEWDRIQLVRSQAKMQQAGNMSVQMVGETPVVVQGTKYFDYKSGQFVEGVPQIKPITQPTEAGSGAKTKKSRIDNAILASANIRTLVKEAGGYAPLKEAATAYTAAIKKDPTIATKLPEDVKSMDTNQLAAMFAAGLGKNAANSSEAMQYADMLKRGRDYVKATSEYFGRQAIAAQEGVYVDPDNLDVVPLQKGAKRPLKMGEKHMLNDAVDWTKASKEDLLLHTNPDDLDNYVEAAARYLKDTYKPKK